jgi:hypothetical protein
MRCTRKQAKENPEFEVINWRRPKGRTSSSGNCCMSLSIRDYSIGGLATTLDDGVGKDPLISSL